MDDNEKTVLDDRNEKTAGFGSSEKNVIGSNKATRSSLKSKGPIKYVKRPSVRPNKAWEPQFKMQLNPPDFIKMRWLKGVPVQGKLTIFNNLKQTQCYKIKCNDNAVFRVRPPMNIIEPGCSAEVQILHTSTTLPDKEKHYFAIYHIKCSREDARSYSFNRIWKSGHADGVFRMPVCFETSELKVIAPSTNTPSSSSADSPLPGKTPRDPRRLVPGGSKESGRPSMKRK